MTSQEQKLWNLIKNKQFYGYKFLRQYIIGEYIVDFVCREAKIIIEIDGGQHNLNENIEYDKKRTQCLKNLNYRVIRFCNNDIDNDMEGVYQKLQDVFGIKTAPTPPLPHNEGEINIKDKNLYYIGGVVRDEILGLPSVDIDLTYNGDAIEFAKNLPNAEIVQINEPFGTVRIKLKPSNNTEIFKILKQVQNDKNFGEDTYIEIDIASTRSESYPQKGHLPVVDKIGCSLKEDVMRRDFTINALAKSTLTGEITDYTGGVEDIKNKILRVLHDNSFIDDPTRILRALKFSVRFNFKLDEHTKKLQEEYLANINYDMSYKRLKKELIETFNLNSRAAFKKFVKQGIYKLISAENFELPEYNFSPLIQKYKPNNVWIIYVGLLPNISSLPLTKTEQQIVDGFKKLKNTTYIYEKENKYFEIYKIFKSVPIESVIMYSTINSQIVEKYLGDLNNIEISINGNDLKLMGIEPSPKYQECFDYILENKIANPNLTDKDEIELAKKFFAL